MRIVLVSYHFPPDPAVGGLRAAKVAEALRRAGHQVHVVAAQMPEAPSTRVTLPSGVVVERVRPWRSPREFWAARKQRANLAGSAGTPMPPTEGTTRPPRVPAWKRAIFSLLWLPDDRQGFIVPATSAARRAFGSAPDLVYTSAPPFSAHLVGLRLASPQTRWIAEFRDPWTDNPWKPAHVRTSVTDRIERWLENRVIGRAQWVVAVSAGIARRMRAKLPATAATRVRLVRNGIDWLAPEPPEPSPRKPLRIVHVGSFYFGRDPTVFLTALAAVVRRHRLSPAELQVDLVGRCRWYNTVSVEAEVARLGLTDVVRFQDWLPHDACQAIVRSADALLLLAQHQPDQVPNKLYEYLGTRRPIIAFADEQGETAEMLRAAGGHVVVSGDDPALAEPAIERSLGLGTAVPLPPPDATLLIEWTTERQMRELSTLVEGAAQ